jgi:hypothetical protein
MTHNEDAVDQWVERQLAKAPPLTDEQRAKLAELLRPVRVRRERPDTP